MYVNYESVFVDYSDFPRRKFSLNLESTSFSKDHNIINLQSVYIVYQFPPKPITNPLQADPSLPHKTPQIVCKLTSWTQMFYHVFQWISIFPHYRLYWNTGPKIYNFWYSACLMNETQSRACDTHVGHVKHFPVEFNA